VGWSTRACKSALCLRDEQDEWKTRVHGTDVTEGDCRNRSAFKVQLEASACIPSGDEPFPEAERLQQLQRARLDAERTGLTRAIAEPVDNPKPRAERLKLGRQGEPGWACADDQRVNLGTARPHSAPWLEPALNALSVGSRAARQSTRDQPRQ
jgi:hypothetical protein